MSAKNLNENDKSNNSNDSGGVACEYQCELSAEDMTKYGHEQITYTRHVMIIMLG